MRICKCEFWQKKMRLWNCEFWQKKCGFEIVNFDKNDLLKMQTLLKMRFQYCEFLEFLDKLRIFALVSHFFFFFAKKGKKNSSWFFFLWNWFFSHKIEFSYRVFVILKKGVISLLHYDTYFSPATQKCFNLRVGR